MQTFYTPTNVGIPTTDLTKRISTATSDEAFADVILRVNALDAYKHADGTQEQAEWLAASREQSRMLNERQVAKANGGRS